jgi:hypothetical protein
MREEKIDISEQRLFFTFGTNLSSTRTDRQESGRDTSLRKVFSEGVRKSLREQADIL